jgi:hypothetical protein
VQIDPAFVVVENCTINDLTWNSRAVSIVRRHTFASMLPAR